MITLSVFPLSAAAWLNDHPIAMLLFAIAWLALLVFLIKWIFQLGVLALFFVITFFLPFDFSRDD